jgi:hypothetical protein
MVFWWFFLNFDRFLKFLQFRVHISAHMPIPSASSKIFWLFSNFFEHVQYFLNTFNFFDIGQNWYFTLKFFIFEHGQKYLSTFRNIELCQKIWNAWKNIFELADGLGTNLQIWISWILAHLLTLLGPLGACQ